MTTQDVPERGPLSGAEAVRVVEEFVRERRPGRGFRLEPYPFGTSEPLGWIVHVFPGDWTQEAAASCDFRIKPMWLRGPLEWYALDRESGEVRAYRERRASAPGDRAQAPLEHIPYDFVWGGFTDLFGRGEVVWRASDGTAAAVASSSSESANGGDGDE